VERRIDDAYIKTGKIKFTFKYYPVVDQGNIGESHWAAYAAECANEQGKFWEYHDKLFVEWRGEFVGTYTKSNLKKYAADIGLDTAKFNQCLDSERTKSIVDADAAEAKRTGVRYTPTFFVNGKQISIQSLDLSQFSRVIDPLLK
jgi:protein-disulfide isomerase